MRFVDLNFKNFRIKLDMGPSMQLLKRQEKDGTFPMDSSHNHLYYKKGTTKVVRHFSNQTQTLKLILSG